MIHTTRTVKDIRVAFETYIKMNGNEESCRLLGTPMVGYGLKDGKIINPSWVCPVEITENGVVDRKQCLVFNEQTDSVCFWTINQYNWREAPIDFVFSDYEKKVRFIVGYEPKAEVCYKNLQEMTPDAESNVRNMTECLEENFRSSQDFYRIYGKCRIESVSFMLYKGVPVVVSKSEGNYESAYFKLYIGLSQVGRMNRVPLFRPVIKREFGNDRFCAPEVGKSYLLHEKDYYGSAQVYGKRMIPVKFNGTRFEYIAFRDADFGCLPRSDY